MMSLPIPRGGGLPMPITRARPARGTMLTLALAAILPARSVYGQSMGLDSVVGFVLPDSSCPQAAYVLTPCTCTMPQIDYYLFSTKIDLSRYAQRYLTLRGTIEPGNCQAQLFEVRKVALNPNPPPCVCPPSRGAGAPSATAAPRR